MHKTVIALTMSAHLGDPVVYVSKFTWSDASDTSVKTTTSL